jgi:hypothetical protein
MQRLRRMAMTNPQDRFPGGSSGARLANMPPRSRAFVTAISAGLCGLVGLLLGGYGVDLVRLQRPDFEYGTLLTAAIVGGLGWCAGAVVAWRLPSARPAASRADVVLLVLGAVVVLWFGVPIARSLRYAANLGPMLDEGSLDEPLLPVISVAAYVDVIVVAFTLVGLAASRLRRLNRLSRFRVVGGRSLPGPAGGSADESCSRCGSGRADASARPHRDAGHARCLR